MGEVVFRPIGWHKGMTYAEEKQFFEGFCRVINEFEKNESKKIFREKDTIAWLPEYDEMMMTYLTPSWIKYNEEKGKSKEDILAMAEDEIVRDAHYEYKCGYLSSRTRLAEVLSIEDYKHGTYAKHRVREVMNTLLHKTDRCPDCYLWTYGYPDKVEEHEREVAREKRAGYQGLLHVQESKIGKQSFDELDKSGYSIQSDALGMAVSTVDPEKKTITLNKASSKETQALSLVHAACLAKQERNGVDASPETLAVRKADALTAQLVFAEEMRQKNPEILKTFRKNGNGPMCDAFEKSMAKTGHSGVARSAAVDCYLNAAVPDNKPSDEKISKICKDFNGYSYYVAQKAGAVKTASDLFNESAFNSVFAAKAKQEQAAKSPAKRETAYDEPAFNAVFAAKAKQGGR